METTKTFLENLVKTAASENKIFKRNLVKEYFQILVLDFIYSHPRYSKMFFYGGSCLAHCFGLPRLSEDLDFVDLKREMDLQKIARDLEVFFQKKTDLNLKSTTQKFRIYMKFPILHELGLAEKHESNLLFLKIEIFSGFDFCKTYKEEIVPLFKFGKSILIRTFDMPTLMATKLRAILYRKWEKTDKKGKISIKVKGRDYFDLMWYLGKGVEPNIKCIEKIKDKKDLKEKLLKIISRIDSRSVRIDLEALIADVNFVRKLSKDIKEILKRKITENF